MSIKQLITKLRKSNLYAECPCGAEFKLSRSILFDGTKPFPEKALEIQKRFKEELKDREDKLKKRRKLATGKAGTLQEKQGEQATIEFEKLLDEKLTRPSGMHASLARP